jgi:hypothetical protein
VSALARYPPRRTTRFRWARHTRGGWPDSRTARQVLHGAPSVGQTLLSAAVAVVVVLAVALAAQVLSFSASGDNLSPIGCPARKATDDSPVTRIIFQQLIVTDARPILTQRPHIRKVRECVGRRHPQLPGHPAELFSPGIEARTTFQLLTLLQSVPIVAALQYVGECSRMSKARARNRCANSIAIREDKWGEPCQARRG